MMEQLKTWFLGRSQRERNLLTVAAGLAAIVLLVFGIALPVYAAIGSAEKELDAAIQRRGAIEAVIQRRGAIEAVVTSAKFRPVARNNLGGENNFGGSLEAAILASATAAGFELADGTAIGVDEYRFRLASTKAGALVVWITNLESQGIELSSISLRGGEGGFVSADVRVRRKI